MAHAGLAGFLQNLSGSEMIVILIVALVVLGPERLPELARSAGRGLHKLRTMTEGLQTEVRDVLDDPSMKPLRDLGEFAARPRQKLGEYALEAQEEELAKRRAEAHANHAAAVDEEEPADSVADPGSEPGPSLPDGFGEPESGEMESSETESGELRPEPLSVGESSAHDEIAAPESGERADPGVDDRGHAHT
jgi:sec-independent protein translocase protein TatB